METRWLTYEELGALLDIAPASAKRLAIRRKWAKKPGNDGKALVCVPLERLPENKPVTDVSGDSPHDDAGDIARDDAGETLTIVTALNRHIERLEKDLEVTKAELGAERQRANALATEAATAGALKNTIEALKEALQAEKQRGAEVRQERDRWHQVATAPVPEKPRWSWWFKRSA